MRGVHIFSGNSHPALAATICERLGTVPATAQLGEFANGETSVNIGVSVRNQDVYIVQSGSSKINDSVMELLIMISACKGGSAKSITGVFLTDCSTLHRLLIWLYSCYAVRCTYPNLGPRSWAAIDADSDKKGISRILASPSRKGIGGPLLLVCLPTSSRLLVWTIS